MHSTDTEKFTRADYAQLPEGFPAYLLDGQLVREPAPTFGHQAVVGELHLRLEAVARHRVLMSPMDVVIDDLNVLQPDLLVFREGVRAGLSTPPEEIPILVVEVLSPSTARRDRRAKTAIYLRAGIAEVWLVDPVSRTIDVVTPVGKRHHEADEAAVSAAVPGLRLIWSDIERARA